MPSVSFDGTPLDSLGFEVGDQDVRFANPIASMVDIPGRRGHALAYAKPGPIDIRFSVTAIGGTMAERRGQFGALAALLDVDSPRWLELPDMGGRRYMAVPTDAQALRYYHDGLSAELSFTAPDPFSYGEAHSETLPSGGTLAIEVGGDAPTALTVAASSAVRDSTSQVWGVTDATTGLYSKVATGSASGRRVEIDAGNRTAKVSGSAKALTLDSSWLVLEPGSHELSMEGTGAATVSWFERWH